MTFALHFRQHVTPRLRKRIDLLGTQLALDLTDWASAGTAIDAEARRFGAARLDNDTYFDLEDWIGRNLLDAMLDAEGRVAEVEAKAAADPVSHYTALTASCADPERMKWVFAAISPEYRAHLLAEQAGGA